MKTKIFRIALSLFLLSFISLFFVNAALNINVLEPNSNGQFFINSIPYLNITSSISANCTYNVNSGTNYTFASSNFSNHNEMDFNISPYSQGLNTINIFCIKSDNSSISNSTTRTFIKDNSSPITSDNAPFGWRTSPFTITLSPIDLYSGVFQTYYNINFGAWTNGTSISISNTGTHFISYYSIDNLNQTESTNNISVALDINKPITLNDAPAFGWYNSPYNVTLNASDLGSGTSFTTYRINGANWSNGTIVSILIEGNNTLEYFSTDIAGNVENIKTTNVGLDINTPNTTNNLPLTWQNSPYNITLNASDLGSGVILTSFRINGGAWINGTSIPVSLEGNNTIEYYSRDLAGNIESSKTIYSLIDFTNPNSSDNAPSGWQSTPFNITLNASDNLSGINSSYYRINSGNWTNGSLIIINTSGNYSIDYYTTDNAGNSNNISNINVVLDFTAPVTTDDAPTGWQTSPFNITLNASDLGSGLNKTYYRINFGPWINNLIIPITNSGIYSIDYYSVDYAGYVEPTNSFSVHLDMELPTSSDNAPTGWQTNPFNISLTGNDSYSNINYITYRIDGANWTNGTNILINNSGNYTLEYYAVDIAGNTQSPKTTNILLDTYLENITYNISADWQITPYNISLNISDNVSGIDYVSYRLNGGNWTNSSLIIANQSGYFNVDFFAADKAGNILPINNFSIKLDLDLPYTTDTSPVGWRKTPFNIILSSNDDTSGVVYTSYRLNNGSWINGTLVPINIAGNHTLEYFAQDLAGNYELIKNVSAKLDNLAPNSSDNAPITNWYSNPLNISLNASDIHTGVSYISYRVDGSNWTNGTNLIINTSGNHSFQYFSVDNLGNIETIKTKYISLDFDSPITTDDAPSVWQSTPFLITLSASDNASGVLNTTYRINGGNWTNGTIIFINSPGNYSIEYFSSDLAGNIENINYISVGLDILKPTTSDNAPSSWQNSSFNITLNATDDAQVAYTNYRINGASWKSGTNIVINSSGNFTIDYHSVDSIGNVENIKTINVLLDLTKPNASDNALNSWQTSPYNITLAGNDTFSGLEQIYYRINGGNWTNGTKIIINSSANHSIEYYAKDKANNTNQIKNIFGLMDISKPITSDDAPIGWQTSSFNINLNASDTGIGVSNTSYRIDGGNWTIGNTILMAQSGTYFIEYFSIDKLGNIENIKNTSVKLDLNSSKVTSIKVLSPVTYKLGKDYYFNLSLDQNTNVKNLTLNFNGTQYLLNNNSINYYLSLNNLASGIYNYNFIINTLSNITYNTSNTILEIIQINNDSIIAETNKLQINSNKSKIIIPKSSPTRLINISLNSSLSLNESMNFYLNLSNPGNSVQSNLSENLKIFRKENTTIYEIEFQANTTLKANLNWNKLFQILKKSKQNYSVASGSVNIVLEMASKSNRINLSKPAKIRIPGMSGKSAAWAFNSTNLTKITTTCNSVTNPTNINPSSTKECYVNSGSDLLIWTYHFTDFAAYTPVVVTPPPDDDDDDEESSSSSSSSKSYTSSKIYYLDDEENENETELETSIETISENIKKYIIWPKTETQKLNASNGALDFNYLENENSIKIKGILSSNKIITIVFKDRPSEVMVLNESTNYFLDSNNNGEADIKVWFSFVDTNNVKISLQPLYKDLNEELAQINLNTASEETNENTQTVQKINSIKEVSNTKNEVSNNNDIETNKISIEDKTDGKIAWWVYLISIILIIIILYFPVTYIRWRIYLKEEKLKEINLYNNHNQNHLKKHIVNHVIDEEIINKNINKKDNHSMEKYLKKREEEVEEFDNLEDFDDTEYEDDFTQAENNQKN